MPPINIKPAGFHFKNNPIKALYYRNFYRPNPRALDKYVSIENTGADELYKAIEPYTSSIGNYAKANNLSVDISCLKATDPDKILFGFKHLDKKGRITFPIGFSLVKFNPKESELRIGEQIAKLFKDALKP